MNEAISEMLKPYDCQTPADYKNALKEIVQQIALLGLSRQGFFYKTAFYGGTALRIGHGLNRFSEDMDFTLLKPDPNFSIEKYLMGVEQELLSYELKFSTYKVTKKFRTPIESAFIKGNTLEILISIDNIKFPVTGTHKNELLKIKMEIDTDPPQPSGMCETLFLTNPIPFSYNILELSSLFAGKLHAIISRDYPSGCVKGRDFYDFIWYMKKKVTPDLQYLEAKLKQSSKLDENEQLSLDKLKLLLTDKLSTVDFTEAEKDVAPFIKDEFELKVWSAEFFNSLIQSL